MGEIRAVPRVNLVTAICYSSSCNINNILDLLQERYGSIEIKSEVFQFRHTNYYEQEMGSDLNLKVNLSQPDKWIHVHIRDKNIFVYSESIETKWGGNPLESSSTGGCALIDGHMSDFVSTMMVMRRGMHIFPVIFSDNLDSPSRGMHNY